MNFDFATAARILFGAGQRRGQADPPGVAAHDLDDHDALVALAARGELRPPPRRCSTLVE